MIESRARQGLVIAVDGPTASGKGTIAKALAQHYGLPHLDTGLLYRAVGIATVRRGGNPDSEADAVAACIFEDGLLGEAVLRSESAGGLASRVSRHPGVRAALLSRQRAFAAQPGGAVLDGRDIGTVIAPDAQAKLFVTASLPARAQRRHREMAAAGSDITLAALTAELAARDARDSSRSAAPLRQAEDALRIDTSGLSIEQAVAEAVRAVEAARMRG